MVKTITLVLFHIYIYTHTKRLTYAMIEEFSEFFLHICLDMCIQSKSTNQIYQLKKGSFYTRYFMKKMC